jgi:hypothetical protein
MSSKNVRLKMEAEGCYNCRYFFPANQLKDGFCRRRAPTVRDLERDIRVWPRVFWSEWCGEREPIPQGTKPQTTSV